MPTPTLRRRSASPEEADIQTRIQQRRAARARAARVAALRSRSGAPRQERREDARQIARAFNRNVEEIPEEILVGGIAYRRLEERANSRLDAARRRAGERPLARLRSGIDDSVAAIERNARGFREKIAKLEGKIELLQRTTRARSIDLPGVEDGTTFRGKKLNFMFTRAIRFLLTGREEGSEFEAEVFRESEKRSGQMLVGKTALEAGTDSLGGFLIPQQIVQELIDLIRANAVVMAAGATMMGGLTGSPVQIPKQTQASTAYWVAENSAPTESNQAFGQISMQPHEAAAMVKLSKRLVMLSSPGAEALVRDDLSQQLALFIDLAVLRGTGASGAPIGIANSVGINTVAVGTNGGALTYDLLVDIVQAVRDDNGLRNAKSVGWIMSTSLIGVLMKLRDADDRPLLLPITTPATDWAPGTDGSGGPVGRLLGYPVYDTTQIPTTLSKGATSTGLTEIYFGDIGTVLIGQWGGVVLEASDQTSTAFQDRQVWILISQLLDVAIRQEQRLCYVNDVLAA